MRRFSYRGLQRSGGWCAGKIILEEQLLMKRESKSLSVSHLLEVDLSRGSSKGGYKPTRAAWQTWHVASLFPFSWEWLATWTRKTRNSTASASANALLTVGLVLSPPAISIAALPSFRLDKIAVTP